MLGTDTYFVPKQILRSPSDTWYQHLHSTMQPHLGQELRRPRLFGCVDDAVNEHEASFLLASVKILHSVVPQRGVHPHSVNDEVKLPHGLVITIKQFGRNTVNCRSSVEDTALKVHAYMW